MNKLQQLHQQVIDSKVYPSINDNYETVVFGTDEASIKTAELTEQIALAFDEWEEHSEEARDFWRKHRTHPTMDSSHLVIEKKHKKTLFRMFIKTL